MALNGSCMELYKTNITLYPTIYNAFYLLSNRNFY